MYDDTEMEMDYSDPLPMSRTARHTARKTHPCEECHSLILPGERYTMHVFVGEDGFQVLKAHTDAAVCAASFQALLAASRLSEQEAYEQEAYEQEFGAAAV